MNTKQQPFKVLIAGGGTAGWMAAALFTKQFAHCCEITLVESESIGTVGVGEATIPPLRVFHDLAGIDERTFMRETQATFKLGIRFENWAAIGDSYFHSFGKTGSGSWAADFHHYWLHARTLGFEDAFSDFSLETLAANEDRFAKDTRDTLNYAYHLNATAYAKFLRKLSEARGLRRVEGIIDSVVLDESTGHVTSIKVNSNQSSQELAADFFIDCTGHRSLLLGKHLKIDWISWSHWLACDAAVAVQSQAQDELPPFTIARAHTVGWQWRIPLQNRVGNGHVYASELKSEDAAMATLQENLVGKMVSDPISLKFSTGRRAVTWAKNVCALGLANGFVEPLESTSIHMINAAVVRLAQLLPFYQAADSWETARKTFNEQINREWDMVRDFIILHYKVTEREDSEFWQRCKTMPIPTSLEDRIGLFEQTAQFSKSDRELFQIDSWTQVLFGQKCYPRSVHPQALQLDQAQLRRFLDAIKEQKQGILTKLPAHGDFVKRYLSAD